MNTRDTVIRQSMMRILCAVLVFMALLCGRLSAQPQLNFKRIVNNWPTIELYFTVGCNGQPMYFKDKQYFRVTENGAEITNFTLWCPDPLQPVPMSVSLVFDASGSMSGNGNAGAKAAGHAFIDQLDSTRDEAAVLWFSSAVTVRQPMTSSVSLLHAAIDALPAGGSTAVWDGAYFGLLELVQNGTKPMRGVIVLTDGADNSSTRQPAEIITLANQERIRVFTIGLGSGINSAQLQAIANLTGGRYYETPNPGQLAAIFQEIYTIMAQGFQECYISYTATCMDGATHVVDLSVLNFCGGSDTKTKTYKALKDTSTWSAVRLGLGEGEGPRNTAITVPVMLLDTVRDLNYPAGSYLVLFDDAKCVFQSASAQPGSILQGVSFTSAPVAGGVLITQRDRKSLPGTQPPGVLFELTFMAGSGGGMDTASTALVFDSAFFDSGCLKPVLSDGELRIINRNPRIACDLIMSPDSMRWNSANRRYDPSPTTISAIVRNNGQLPAYGATFRLVYNSADLSLVNPADSVIAGTPTVIDSAGVSTAQWKVVIKPRAVDGFVTVRFEISCDNHPTVPCTKQVWVSAADAFLTCSASVPSLSVDKIHNRYDPMPFELYSATWNIGGKGTGLVTCGIVLPPGDLRLSGADSSAPVKSLNPSVLGPGQFGHVTWALKHPITTKEKSYVVGVWSKTVNADSIYCETKVVIPAYPVAVLAAWCRTPDSLRFDNQTGRYVPETFEARVECRNIGTWNASSVSARISLPPELMLDPSELGVTTKTFTPSVITPYVTGDPVPTLIWRVRARSISATPRLLPISFELAGRDSGTQVALDTARATCSVRIPGVPAAYACAAYTGNPDSLIRDATKTGLDPDPFSWTAAIANTGLYSSVIVDAEIGISSGLTLDASTPAVQHPSAFLKSGDTAHVTWLLHPAYSLTRRTDTIRITYTDDRGTRHACESLLPVQGVDASLSCLLAGDVSFLRYDETSKQYVPDSWTVTGTLRNDGKVPLTMVQATITWTDPGGVRLAKFDPGYPDNSNPKSVAALTPGQQAQFRWGFAVDAINRNVDTAIVDFSIAYQAIEMPLISVGCDVSVFIGPAGTTGIGTPVSQNGFVLQQNFPNPFRTTTTVRYILSDRGPESSHGSIPLFLKVFDLYGRQVREISMERNAPGEHAATLDATGLPPGVYEYRLVGPGVNLARMMIVLR